MDNNLNPDKIAKIKADLKARYGEEAPDDRGSLAAWVKGEPQQTGIGEDELLDKFEHRMEFELSLNATQTAHARQILSDLMDTLEPQQTEGELALDLMSTMNVVVGNAIYHRDDPQSGVDYGDFKGVAKNLVHIFKEHGWAQVPSEDELALWLCDHLSYTSRELAHELLKLLKGEQKP